MSKITNQRKITYYIGMGMIIVGFLLFMSVFLSVASFMDNTSFTSSGPSFKNAIIGMILMISGTFVSNIGAKGAAGSGLVLDPDKAREDLKPFNEAKGAMINDVISNIDIVDDLVHTHTEKEVIKIRCRSCGSLNDEDAKFCKNCGKEI
jgi:hypothetical protein